MSKMSDHTTPCTFTGWTCPTSWHVEVHVMHWLGMSDVHTHSPHQSIVHVAPCIGVKLQPWYTALHAHTVTYNHAASCTYSVFHHCGCCGSACVPYPTHHRKSPLITHNVCVTSHVQTWDAKWRSGNAKSFLPGTTVAKHSRNLIMCYRCDITHRGGILVSSVWHPGDIGMTFQLMSMWYPGDVNGAIW